MRIAFVGKGGSGKSTLTALFASYVSSKHTTLVIDADFNMHVGVSLGVPSQTLHNMKKIGEHGKYIKDFVRGKNSRITSSQEIIKTTPPSLLSNFIRLDFTKENILREFTVQHKNLFLMCAGSFQDTDVGSNCFHKYTGIVEIFLNHLLDKQNEYVVVDMTAGVDAFGTGLFSSFDITCMVVEPTLRSVSVFNQYKDLASSYNIPFKAIGNKVKDKQDIDFLKKEIGDDLISYITLSKSVTSFEQGKSAEIEYKHLEPENKQTIKDIYRLTNTLTRDWETFYKNLCALHIKNNVNWAQDHFKKDLGLQIDPNFSYKKVL